MPALAAVAVAEIVTFEASLFLGTFLPACGFLPIALFAEVVVRAPIGAPAGVGVDLGCAAATLDLAARHESVVMLLKGRLEKSEDCTEKTLWCVSAVRSAFFSLCRKGGIPQGQTTWMTLLM